MGQPGSNCVIKKLLRQAFIAKLVQVPPVWSRDSQIYLVKTSLCVASSSFTTLFLILQEGSRNKCHAVINFCQIMQ